MRVFLLAVTLIGAQLSLAGPAAAIAGKRCSPEGRERVTSAGTFRCVRDGIRGLVWMTVAPASATTLPPVTTTTPPAKVPRLKFTTTTIRTSYTVTYNGNGNSTGYAPSRERVLITVTLRIATNSGNLARTGYRFGGWCSAPTEVGRNCAGVKYLPFEVYAEQTDVTLYALWIGLTCETGGTCQLGDIGPGGGRVFYVASSPFSSPGSLCDSRCRYLEYAPESSMKSWASNYEYVDSQGTRRNNQLEAVNGAMARGIGFGYQNSLDIAFKTGNTAASSAAVYALEYKYNTWRDWHLPSVQELEALRQYVHPNWSEGCVDTDQPNEKVALKDRRLVCRNYWSSTQSTLRDPTKTNETTANDPTAWTVALRGSDRASEDELASGTRAHHVRIIKQSFPALPIRAFGPINQPGS